LSGCFCQRNFRLFSQLFSLQKYSMTQDKIAIHSSNCKPLYLCQHSALRRAARPARALTSALQHLSPEKPRKPSLLPATWVPEFHSVLRVQYSIPGVRLCQWLLPSNDVTAWIITSTPLPTRGPCSVFVDPKHRDYCTYRLHQ